jgi:hypothetical protein
LAVRARRGALLDVCRASVAAVREFLDREGVHWRVWATVPTHLNAVADDLRTGWLTFVSGAQRRRLAPIPRNWESMDDERLRLAVAAATAVTRVTPASGVRAASPDSSPSAEPPSGQSA